jgi:hypothetical protein
MLTISRKFLSLSAELPLLLFVALALSLSSPVLAGQDKGKQPPAAMGQGPQNAQMQAFLKTRQELQQVRQQLAKIQQDTVKSNPELKKQQDALQQHVFKVMKDNGHTPEADLKALQDMRKQAKNKDLSDEKRQDLARKFQQKAVAFQRAQQEAMQDEDINKRRQELSQNLITAMNDQDPDTQKLLKRAKELTAKLRQIQQQVQQQHNAPAKQ